MCMNLILKILREESSEVTKANVVLQAGNSFLQGNFHHFHFYIVRLKES